MGFRKQADKEASSERRTLRGQPSPEEFLGGESCQDAKGLHIAGCPMSRRDSLRVFVARPDDMVLKYPWTSRGLGRHDTVPSCGS